MESLDRRVQQVPGPTVPTHDHPVPAVWRSVILTRLLSLIPRWSSLRRTQRFRAVQIATRLAVLSHELILVISILSSGKRSRYRARIRIQQLILSYCNILDSILGIAFGIVDVWFLGTKHLRISLFSKHLGDEINYCTSLLIYMGLGQLS